MPTANFSFSLEDHRDPSSFSRAVAKQQINLLPDGSSQPLATSRSKDLTPQSNLTTWSYSDILQGAATIKPVGASYDVFNQTTSKSFLDILGTATDGKSSAPLGLDNLLPGSSQQIAPYDIILRAKMNATNGNGKNLNDVVASATGVPGGSTGSSPHSETTHGGGTVTIVTVQGIQVNQSISAQFDKLMNAAKGDGINFAGFGFRSYETQIQLRKTNGCPDVFNAPAESCRIPTAIPGTSQHEQGLAIDFQENGQKLTRSSRGFNWLGAHAATYGFKNLPSEPWHWSTTGT